MSEENRKPKKPYYEFGVWNCKECGVEVDTDWAYCPFCGIELDWSEENEID